MYKYTRSFLLVAAVVALAGCAHEASVEPASLPVEADRTPLSRTEVTEEIEGELGRGRLFSWAERDDRFVYSAAVAEDSLVSVGYWLGDSDGWERRIGLVDTDSDAWRELRETLIAVAWRAEREALGAAVSREDLLAGRERVPGVPQLTLRLRSPGAVAALRAHEAVRYVEPLGFELADQGLRRRSDKGCEVSPPASLPGADYVELAPAGKSPWNFGRHRIREAQSLAQGTGVRVQIIDTGAGEGQENLGADFSAGAPATRDVRKVSTHYSGWWWWRALEGPDDVCGHGTQMAGLAVGPRAGDGNAVGVAYGADLTSVRAVEDVLITSSEESEGVRDALVLAGDDPSTRIVSMSIGSPLDNATVRDGIYYAYNRGKLLLAAAGTSLEWLTWYGVVFPASMPEVVAVTGVQEGQPYAACATCHAGPEVDFVIEMQRRGEADRTSLSLALGGDDPVYVGGSSAATATTAGIAALVWSRHPGLDRAGVVDRLARASVYYPDRDPRFGWGGIDAYEAVR